MSEPRHPCPDLHEARLVTVGARVWVGGHDSSARRATQRCLAETIRAPSGPLDAAIITPQSADEAVHFAQKLHNRLAPNGTVWIIQRRQTDISDEQMNASGGERDRVLRRCGLVRRAEQTVDDEYTAVGYRFSPPDNP